MVWDKDESEVVFHIVDDENPDFERCYDHWIRCTRERVVIDCEGLQQKKQLNTHEKFKLGICNRISKSL